MSVVLCGSCGKEIRDNVPVAFRVDGECLCCPQNYHETIKAILGRFGIANPERFVREEVDIVYEILNDTLDGYMKSLFEMATPDPADVLLERMKNGPATLRIEWDADEPRIEKLLNEPKKRD